MMGAGYWLEPDTQQSWLVNRHELWVLDPENAKAAGIPPYVYDHIKTLNPVSQEDEIRMAAIQAGLVRIRDQGNRIAVQFAANRGHIREVLWSVFLFLKNKAQLRDKYAPVVIDNFTTKDSVTITLDDLEERLKNELPIMREDVKRPIKDIPLDSEVYEKLRLAFGLRKHA